MKARCEVVEAEPVRAFLRSLIVAFPDGFIAGTLCPKDTFSGLKSLDQRPFPSAIDLELFRCLRECVESRRELPKVFRRPLVKFTRVYVI